MNSPATNSIEQNSKDLNPSPPILINSPGKAGPYIFLLVALISLGSGLGWWLTRSSSVNPPNPTEINDPDVIRVIEKARQEVIANPNALNWGHLGMILTAHQFDQEASVCYQEAHRLDPGDSRWPFIMGMAAIKRDPNHSLDLLRVAVQSNTWPKYHFSMVLALVENLIERSQFEEAANQIVGLQPEGGDIARLAMTQGWLALHRGDEVGATNYFSQMLGNPYGQRKATAQLASLARLTDNTREAERLEKDLLKLPVDQDWPDPLIGEIVSLRVGRRARENAIKRLEEKRKYEDAAELYKDELKADRSLRNLIGVGMNLSRAKKYTEALNYLYEAIKMDPESAHARHNLAVCLLMDAFVKRTNQGNSKEIEDEFAECVSQSRIVIKLKPDHANGCLVCGSALKCLRKYDDAVVVLEQGIACRPESFDLQLTLAEVLFEQGKYEDAKRHIEFGIQSEPNNPRGPQLLERIKQAMKLKEK